MSFINNAYSACASGVPRAESEITPEISEMLCRLLDEARLVLNDDRDAARDCLRRADALLKTQVVKDLSDGRTTSSQALAPWQMRKVTAYIESQLETTIRLEDLAAESRLSRGYFARAFRGSFGQSPHNYILSRRVARAQHHMLTSEEPLVQIALACGFADQAHFCRVFRRRVGSTPTRWRRAHINGESRHQPTL